MNPVCPQCGSELPTLSRPCGNCGLGFVRQDVPCPECGHPLSEHQFVHPTQAEYTLRATMRRRRGPSDAQQTCPLCGGPRHRKDADASRDQCLWRMWAVETGRVREPGNPKATLPARRQSENLIAFAQWLDQPDAQGTPNKMREAGSVPQERILRHQAVGLTE